MDFDQAAQRLARDQSKLRQQRQQRQHKPNKRAQQDLLRRQHAEAARLAQRAQRERAAQFRQRYWDRCEAPLRVQELNTPLKATSIYGDGDKLALPPSVLETLTSSGNTSSSSSSSPWIFRVAIGNPHYAGFPQSKRMQAMEPPDDSMEDDENDESMDLDDDNNHKTEAYLDELSHKYLAWTYGTVVEFTQDEGCIGLPEALAASLIRQGQDAATRIVQTNAAQPPSQTVDDIFPVTRTVDPAAAAGGGSADQPIAIMDDDDDDNDEHMKDMKGDAVMKQHKSHESNNDDDDDEEEEEKTPGHLAWGKFDVPALPLEISLVQLPKGHSCLLQPTREAVQQGFYRLNNIKLVLEQSLIRTRAVLSVGDAVHTWHRGVQYDLRVQRVQPADYRAVVCINTDLTVDFCAVAEDEEGDGDNKQEGSHATKKETREGTAKEQSHQQQGGYTLSGGGGGHALNEDRTTETAPPTSETASPSFLDHELPPEEPAPDAASVGTILIRGPNGASLQRRLDLKTTTVGHVFALGRALLSQDNSNNTAFQLVTRFPRRVLRLTQENRQQLLRVAAGLASGGQEMFLIEVL